MKKVLLVILVVILLAACSLLIPGVRNALGISVSDMVARQIERVTASFLNPTLEIGEVTYSFPWTVGVRDLTLTQDDVRILEIPSGSITLVNIPTSSEKVRFRNFRLDSPVFRMVVDDQGTLVGWGDLLKSSEDRATEGGDDVNASDIFAIKDITVTGATIVYKEGDQRMELDKLDFTLGASIPREEKGADPDAPQIPTSDGWYRLQTNINRDPLIAIEIDSGLNIDNGDLLFKSLHIHSKLDHSNIHVLPPQIQAFVLEHSIHGVLDIDVKGSIPSSDSLAGPLDIGITLEDASIGTEDRLLEISIFTAEGSIKDALMQFDTIHAEILGGTLDADFMLRLEEDPDASSTSVPGKDAYSISCGLQMQDLNLQMLTQKATDTRQLMGYLNVDVEAAGILTEWPDTLEGTGEVTVRDGRLANIPIISSLGRVMRAVLLGRVNDDQLSTSIELRSDGVVIQNLSLIAGMMAVRGSGIIRFDNTIDMVVNGGPLERVQKSLGGIGRALGSLTDRIVRYQVTGSLDSPRVRVRPLGIGTRDPTAPRPTSGSNEGSSP